MTGQEWRRILVVNVPDFGSVFKEEGSGTQGRDPAGTRARGAIRLRGKLAQGPRFPCASGPRPRRRRPAAVPAWITHRARTRPGHAPAARVTCRASSHKGRVFPVRAGLAREGGDQPPSPHGSRTVPGRGRNTRRRRVSLAGQARTRAAFPVRAGLAREGGDQPPSPHGSRTVPGRGRDTRRRRVSLAGQARTRAGFRRACRPHPGSRPIRSGAESACQRQIG